MKSTPRKRFSFLLPIWESLGLGMAAIFSNLTRTFLSLVGVAVGVFCVSGVLMLVDSLEKNIRKDLSFVQADALYIQKWPWTFGNDYPWWKYMKWPSPTVTEFKRLSESLDNYSEFAVIDSRSMQVMKYESRSFENTTTQGVTNGAFSLMGLQVAHGRQLNKSEMLGSPNIVVIGNEIARYLFESPERALNKRVKLGGKFLTVVGVLKAQGMHILNSSSADEMAILPYGLFKTIYGPTRSFGGGKVMLVLRPNSETSLNQMESDITTQMRAIRGIRPGEENNFSINRSEMLTGMISSIFDSITIAGMIIGLFSLLVGGVGIANIMFVSVKERTPLIGIQKAIGAKTYHILIQYIAEAIALCMMGGVLGLAFVLLLTWIPQSFLQLYFDMKTMIYGAVISVSTGILAGILPAWSAARLKPVEAIRRGI